MVTTRLQELQMPQAASISVEIAPGELIDKITILEIKAERDRKSTRLNSSH